MNLPVETPSCFTSSTLQPLRSKACGAKVPIAATITAAAVVMAAVVVAVIVAPIAKLTMLRRYVQTAAVVSAIMVVATIVVIVGPVVSNQ